MALIDEKDLARYVNAAADLALAVEDDITNNEGIISNDTVLALSEFVAACEVVAVVTKALQNKKINLN